VIRWGTTTRAPIRGLLPVVAAVALACTLPATALARHRNPPPGTGFDISYPQCGHSYPSGGAFGIVGVNGGLANDANGCLGSELAWAQTTPGLASPAQPRTSLYINTADPGNGVADWPRSGSSTLYGSCDGSWSQACAYIYGQQRASYSYGLVGGTLASSAPWWLDIETANSWATATNASNWGALNVATIQGFIAGLQGAGAGGPIGFYSTASQWQAITGQTASNSSFPTARDWVAGAATLSQAQANCSASFSGGRVALAQFPSGGFDGDYACP
jgi:hypothetical protein